MSTHRTETSESSESHRGTGETETSRGTRAISTLKRYGQNGSPAMLAGSVLLARAGRALLRGTGRAKTQALAGAALVGLAMRQRRSDRGRPGEKRVSDDAHAARERSDVLHQDEENPRGTSSEPDVETVTEEDEGSIQFTEEGEETRRKPHLDETDPKDPRYADDASGDVEIDISESAMADEASEAAGPTPEQAEPAQTEDTEPESSPPEDASHMQADEPDEAEADPDSDEYEATTEDDEEPIADDESTMEDMATMDEDDSAMDEDDEESR